jgi:hypothetical protein
VKIIETFKSQTEEERRRNVTDAIIALENSTSRRNEAYIPSESSEGEIV